MLERHARLAFLLLALGGCVSTARLQIATSGVVGCPPDEIEVSSRQEEVLGLAEAWQASCRGQTFQCSTQSSTIACAPMLPGAPPAVTASAPVPSAAPAEPPPPPPPTLAACVEAAEYDRRVASAKSPAKEQLEVIAKHKHADCAAAQAQAQGAPSP